MKTLAEKRVRFTKAKLDLELYLYYKGKINGFYYAIGEAKRPRTANYGHQASCHHEGLAVHLLIYDENYGWMHKTDPVRRREILLDAHQYWRTLGGAPLIKGDLHHFSFEHNGVR